MHAVVVIPDTTPEHFGLWLKDTTRAPRWFKFNDYLVKPYPAVGGFYDGGWHWDVPAYYHIPGQPYPTGPHDLISFDVIPITPTRIKVRAHADEPGRFALDALIIRMQEELSGIRLATITSTKETKGEASDASRAKPGTWSPEPQEKLEIWLGWRKAQRKGTRQSVYCDSLKPQIDTSTLRRYKREVVELVLLDKKGNPVQNLP